VYLLVGLGNPGAKYRDHRHNVGFMVVEQIAAKRAADAWKEKFKGRYAKTQIDGRECVLLEPMTYMNLSGESVQAAMQFFKVSLENVVVVHDELDLPWQRVQVKAGGGAAGHNGIKSLIQHCGADFVRVRIGVGRPPGGRSTESWVLSDFDTSERAELPDVLVRAAGAAEAVVTKGVSAAANAFNQVPRSGPGSGADRPRGETKSGNDD
jgi:PTH1 family peptidyl-tRNA hydrolase